MEKFLDSIHLFFFNLYTKTRRMCTQAGTKSGGSKGIIHFNLPVENRENQLIKLDLREATAREDFSLEISLHCIPYSPPISGNTRLYLNHLCI